MRATNIQYFLESYVKKGVQIEEFALDVW